MTIRARDRTRVAAGRAVRRERGARRERGDVAYIVYITLLVAAIVGVPVVRSVALALATTTATRLLTGPDAVHTVAVIGALMWIAALWCGRVRGPIAPPPFLAMVLARSDISPRAAWARPQVAACVGTMLALGTAAALSVSGFLTRGEAVGASLGFIGAALAYAIPTAAVWLAGQVLGRRGTAILAAVLTLLLAAAVVAPSSPTLTPASALAALWPGAGNADVAAVVILATCALAGIAALVILLARIEPHAVEEHARRWEAMTVLAATGDLSGALDRTRAVPSAGRRLRIGFHRPLALAVWERDAVGAARTPLRSLVALLALAVAGAGWAWAAELDVPARWIAAIAVGLVAFAATGALSDGTREAADSAGRPALYATTPGRLLALHLSLPLLCGLVVPVAAVLAIGGSGEAVVLAAATGAAICLVRAYDATKGPLPIELMMPVPTPAGDASAIGVWAWQADALLWTAAISAGFSVAAPRGFAPLLWSLPVMLALAALTVGRLRRSAS